MKINRVMLAAPKSGSGKTTITCGLLQILKNKGKNVVSYKCGPDYIDPMFHRKVIEVPSRNLDTFFTGEAETRALFMQGRKEGDYAVLEGVMGLYDGLGGIRKEGSSYDLARVTGTPIILVVEGKGMGRSVVAEIAGFLQYDKEHLIKGVLLNRVSGSYYQVLKPVIEEELGIKAVGYFPENKQFQMESRHLGLFMPEEIGNIKERLQGLAKELEKTVFVETILEIAEKAASMETEICAPDLPFFRDTETVKISVPAVTPKRTEEPPVLAVARDEAFCFYYEDNLRLLQEAGARLAFFSPMHDSELPKGCAGILLGGGYPELYGQELSANTAMLRAVRRAFDEGMPMVAECGGFLYLHEHMTCKEGDTYPMVGALSGDCCYTGKLVRFGYIELEEKKTDFLWEKERIKGHEFHYFDSTCNGEDWVARKPVTGRTYDCVIGGTNHFLGFPHLYYPSNPEFPKAFVKKVKDFRDKKRESL